MKLIDEEEQRYYCYADDEVFLAKEFRWLEPKTQAEIARELGIVEFEQTERELKTGVPSVTIRVTVLAAMAFYWFIQYCTYGSFSCPSGECLPTQLGIVGTILILAGGFGLAAWFYWRWDPRVPRKRAS